MKCRVLAHTPDPVAVVASAARTVTSAHDPSGPEVPLTQERRHFLIDRAISAGFTSVLRHASVTVAVDGVSIMSLQRMAAKYPALHVSSPDLRRVRVDAQDAYFPPALSEGKPREVASVAIKSAAAAYDDLLALGVAPSDASVVLPVAARCSAIITADLETLSNIAKAEVSASAFTETRELCAGIRREFMMSRTLRPFASLLAGEEEG